VATRRKGWQKKNWWIPGARENVDPALRAAAFPILFSDSPPHRRLDREKVVALAWRGVRISRRMSSSFGGRRWGSRKKAAEWWERVGAEGGKRKKRRRGDEKKKHGDRGKEAEQRKSIVRLLIEKWGRFMGYRQTEVSPTVDCHLVCTNVRQISFAFASIRFPRRSTHLDIGRPPMTPTPSFVFQLSILSASGPRHFP
jgi:hypothetical protein